MQIYNSCVERALTKDILDYTVSFFTISFAFLIQQLSYMQLVWQNVPQGIWVKTKWACIETLANNVQQNLEPNK